MRRPMEVSAKRPRISIDVGSDIRRRLRLASAKKNLTIRQYMLKAIEDRLHEELDDRADRVLALTAKADPVLAELWDNRRDAAYDRL